jgi:sugar transferase (PEP-CTERM/EpsH1 system associated)
MSSASLFLCHRLPFPPNKGDKIRSHALLKHLAGRGRVHLACFIDDPDDLQYRDDVRRLAGGECLFEPIDKGTKWLRGIAAVARGESVTTAFFSSSAMRKWIRKLLATEDIGSAIVFGSAMAPYLLKHRALCRRAIFDMVDVDSDKWRQYAGSSTGPRRWIYAREARAIGTLERQAAHAFGRTLLVSPFEAETFRRLAPESAARIDSLSNGVDLTFFSPGPFASPFPEGELPIVMTGHMDYRPNCDGALWLAEKVAPLLFAEFPNAHFYFVGANPPAALRGISGPGITVTGRVDDVRPYIQGAQVVVAPLSIARGIQNKVLEAMAMKKCVVATRQATRALAVESGRQLWIANDDARSFSDAIAAAIRSPDRQEVMDCARKYVERHHDWATIMTKLDAALARPAKGNATQRSVGLSLCTAPSFSDTADMRGVDA